MLVIVNYAFTIYDPTLRYLMCSLKKTVTKCFFGIDSYSVYFSSHVTPKVKVRKV